MVKRKTYTAEEKVKILRAMLEEGKPVSQIAQQHGLHPNNIFSWRKQLFEGAIQIFQIKRPDVTAKADERRIALLEDKLKRKDEVISELAEELLGIKKKSCGLQ